MCDKINSKRDYSSLVILLSAVYMVSYITRVNLAAIVSEVEAASGIARSSLSLALTASFISYGTGQVLSGYLGDKISPKLEVAIGLLLTSMMNIAMPLCKDAVAMTVIWCVNGFAQSLTWPPIVKIMAARLADDDFKRATTSVSLFSTVGSVSVYLCAPLIITLLNYKWVFVIAGICGLLMFSAWLLFAKDAKKEKRMDAPTVKKGKSYNIFTPLAILLLIATAMQGALRDGVTTWTPTYISDTFSLGSSISILSGVVLPLFAMVSVYVTSRAYRSSGLNPITLAGMIFLGASVFAALLFVFGEETAILSVLLSALLTASMHAINFLLIGMVPGLLARYSNISFLSGVINSATYVGSALSTYGIALLSENYGWQMTIGIWVAIAAAGAAICLFVARPLKASIDTAEE